MVSAPFLASVGFTPPDAAAAKDSTEETAEQAQDTDSEFDAEDFPDWYQDKLGDPDAPPTQAEAEAPPAHRPYFCDLAVVQTIERLQFGPITVIAGDNGSGKSTLVEGIAVASGFNPEGGSRNLMFDTYDTHSALADHLTLRWNRRPKWGWFLRAETFYGMATHIAKDDDPYGGVAAIFPDLHNQSHGESFMALAESRFTGEGLYIFDEPESALSLQGLMRLMAIINASVARGSQFIISTHSPFLMGIPGATVYEFDETTGIEPTQFSDLTVSALWRRFFTDPSAFHDRLQPGAES